MRHRYQLEVEHDIYADRLKRIEVEALKKLRALLQPLGTPLLPTTTEPENNVIEQG